MLVTDASKNVGNVDIDWLNVKCTETLSYLAKV
jgi:hypothetical protein